MRYLLDTHAFIWWDSSSNRLSRRVFDIIIEPANDILISLVSVWEMQIKQQVGKLILARPLAKILESQQQQNDIRLLPIELSHLLALSDLPDHHRDPFDRLLVAQARIENLTLLSADPHIARYPVDVAW